MGRIALRASKKKEEQEKNKKTFPNLQKGTITPLSGGRDTEERDEEQKSFPNLQKGTITPFDEEKGIDGNDSNDAPYSGIPGVDEVESQYGAMTEAQKGEAIGGALDKQWIWEPPSQQLPHERLRLEKGNASSPSEQASSQQGSGGRSPATMGLYEDEKKADQIGARLDGPDGEKENAADDQAQKNQQIYNQVDAYFASQPDAPDSDMFEIRDSDGRGTPYLWYSGPVLVDGYTYTVGKELAYGNDLKTWEANVSAEDYIKGLQMLASDDPEISALGTAFLNAKSSESTTSLCNAISYYDAYARYDDMLNSSPLSVGENPYPGENIEDLEQSLANLEMQIEAKTASYQNATMIDRPAQAAALAKLESRYEATKLKINTINLYERKIDIENDINYYTSLDGYDALVKDGQSHPDAKLSQNQQDFLSDEQKSVYYAILADAGKDEAKDYLNKLQPTVEYKIAELWVEGIMENDDAFWQTLAKRQIDGAAGITEFGQNILQAFNNMDQDPDYVAMAAVRIAREKLRETYEGSEAVASDIFFQIGKNAPTIIATAIAPGLGAAAQTAVAASVIGVNALSTYGSEYEETYLAGWDEQASHDYALASSVMSALVDTAFKGTDKMVSTGIKSAVNTALKDTLKDSDLPEAALQKIANLFMGELKSDLKGNMSNYFKETILDLDVERLEAMEEEDRDAYLADYAYDIINLFLPGLQLKDE